MPKSCLTGGCLVSIVAAAILVGCSTRPNLEPAESVPLSDVLNAVKDELAAYMTTPVPQYTRAGRCFNPKGEPIGLEPKKATVTLKVVDASQVDAAIGLAVPVGVVKFDPAVAAALSETATQTLVVPLDVVRAPTLVAPVPGKYEIAEALVRLRDQLLKVDHNRTPCLKFGEASPIKLSASFEVSKKGSAGFSLNLLVLKVSDKLTKTSATTQTLDLELALTGDQLLAIPAPLK